MDRLTSDRRSWNMSRIRGRDTLPELQLRSLLHRAGFRFRLNVKGLPGRPDIVLPKYRTVIFVHGCFWHRHADCKKAAMPSTRIEFWRDKFEGNVKRDERNSNELKLSGWSVIVAWECELQSSSEKILRRISRYLRRRV